MRLNWDFGIEGRLEKEKLKQFIENQIENMKVGDDFLIGVDEDKLKKNIFDA